MTTAEPSGPLAALEVPQPLIAKYSGPGPRYTSYPTAVEFKGDFSRTAWRAALEPERCGGRFSLYFHIPFCYSLCYFCACHKIIPKTRAVVEPYLAAVRQEIESYRSVLGSEIAIEQIHWGGGSPDYLTPHEIRALHGATLAAFPNLVQGADVSVEVDPRTTTDEHLRAFAEVGFNRLSMGVQDFDPGVQKLINRVQPYEMTKRVFEQALTLGIHSINVDLVYGLPDQTLEGFARTLDQIIELRPARMAVYGYAHVTWIKKVQKALERAHLPTPAERVALFALAVRRLTAVGYRYIGMDHFALPEDPLAIALDDGSLNRNFMGYTNHRGVRILGFGASSISSIPSVYAQNAKDVQAYQELIRRDGLAVERGVCRTEEDRMRADIIEGLLCRREVDIKAFEQSWQVNFHEKFGTSIAALAELIADGLVTVDEEKIALTPLGCFFARNAAMAFDAYLAAHRGGPKPVFSQAV